MFQGHFYEINLPIKKLNSTSKLMNTFPTNPQA